MFRKRYGEMDLYQEYRKSHERVKIMLKEQEVISDDKEVESPPSAQDNLRNFIKQHDTSFDFSEEKTVIEQPVDEQNFIRLDQDTIVQSNADFNFQNSSPFSPENEFNSQTPDNQFQSTPQQNTSYDNNFDLENEYPTDYNSTVQVTAEKSNQSPIKKNKKVEDELEDIIREALTNYEPNTKNQSDDIDPELMQMMKELLLKNNSINPSNETFTNFFSTDQNNFSSSTTDQGYIDLDSTVPENTLQNLQPIEEELQFNDKSYQLQQNEIESKAAVFERQLQGQQAPPKPPTVRRPSSDHPLGPIETTFTQSEYEDDSSLALTKKDIKLQVKNLIKETLENTPESPKPNDLQQLEKQLKEHLDKIKQSRKE